MKFYSFSDLIHYIRTKERNYYWVSRLTYEASQKRQDARYFINYWRIPVSEELWLLYQAMNKMDSLEKWK